MSTYSYDPVNIVSQGIDRMRFELGDTIVDNGALSSPLCDEEYSSVISSAVSWKKAKLQCLEAIMMKLSYEVNTSIDGLSYSLDSRAERWRTMYDSMKKGPSVISTVPTAIPGSYYNPDEPHYFHKNMQANMEKGDNV